MDWMWSLWKVLEWIRIANFPCQYSTGDYTIVSSSHSFVVFDFSFDVLTPDCMSTYFDPLWCRPTFRNADMGSQLRFWTRVKFSI